MNYFPTVEAGSRTDVNKPVSGPNGVLVVLDNDQGVTQVLELDQGLNQTKVVALV